MTLTRVVFACFALLAGSAGCSSDAESATGAGGSFGAAGQPNTSSCPDVSGSWSVTQHCEASLVGARLVATQLECALSFAAPFNEFTGRVSAAGTLTLSGPQSCTGQVSASTITMTCTPGTCAVTLVR